MPPWLAPASFTPATTIGTNISTDGALSATGQTTLGNASSTLFSVSGNTWLGTTIISSGNLGIGTTSPYAKLSVVGETVASYFTATSTTATSTLFGGLNVGSGGFVYDFSSGNTSVSGNLTVSGNATTTGNQTITGDLTVTGNGVGGSSVTVCSPTASPKWHCDYTGDGVDDSVAVNNAISYLEDNNYQGIVQFSDGLFLLADTDGNGNCLEIHKGGISLHGTGASFDKLSSGGLEYGGTTLYTKTTTNCNMLVFLALSYGTATFTVADDLVTLIAHGRAANDQVFFSGGDVPTNVSKRTRYYVKAPVTADSFKISATEDGEAIDFVTVAGCVTSCTSTLRRANMNYFNNIEKIHFFGNNTVNTAGNAIKADETFNDVHILHSFINRPVQDGVQIANSWGWVLDDVVIEYGKSGGGGYAINSVSTTPVVYTNGGPLKLVNAKIIANSGLGNINIAVGSRLLVTGSLIGTVSTSGQIGLYLNSDNAVISTNTFSGGVTNGIDVALGSNTDGAIITSNTFNANSTQKNAISFGSTPTNIIITGNSFCGDGSTQTYTDTTNGIINLSGASSGANIFIDSAQGCLYESRAATGNAVMYGETRLVGTSAAQTITLPTPNPIGLLAIGLKKIFKMTNATNAMTVSVTNHKSGTPLTCSFDTINQTWILMWGGSEWTTISSSGGTADCT